MEPGSRVSKRERNIDRAGEREQARERGSQMTHLSSLSLNCRFFSSSAFSFVFTAQKLLPFLPIHLLSFSLALSPTPSSRCRLVDFGQQHAIISGHHRPPQVRIQGNEDQQDSGREFVRRGFNESERGLVSRQEMYANDMHTPKRTLGRRGERRLSSRWTLRKMSGSGQKNGNKTPPTPFLLLLSFFFILHLWVQREDANWLTHKMRDEVPVLLHSDAVDVFSFLDCSC